jgi:DNA-directed RNA polymerase subunit K
MTLEKMGEKFTKYEIARILGARALQLAMDAPVLLKIDAQTLDDINYDVLKIAEMEFESEVLPITVKRPFPEKSKDKIKKIEKEEDINDGDKVKEAKVQEQKREAAADKKIEEKEVEEEKEIAEEGEIMELAVPYDEVEEEENGGEEGV